MPATEDFLKFFCILKKRNDGGFDHYYNARGNYWRPEEYLGAHGFVSWQHVYNAEAHTLEGFVACQMRPRVTLLTNETGGSLYAEAKYDTPFEQWKFALRHQPSECPVPDWVCVGEIRAECIRLLPKWAKSHLVYHGLSTCEKGMAIVALEDSSIAQYGGTVWTYGSSTVFQRPGNCSTSLHETSTGFIEGRVAAYDHSRVELSRGGRARAYGSATVILRPGEDGATGEFAAYGSGVSVFRPRPGAPIFPGRRIDDRELTPVDFVPLPEPKPYEPKPDVNLPFGCPVD